MGKRHIDEIMSFSASSLEQAIEHIRKNAPDVRVAKLNVGQSVYWMKQAEQHSTVKNRLRKGDGTEALHREQQNLKALSERNIPVPELVAATDDYFVISDCGLTLNDMLYAPNYCADEGVRAFYHAGRALAQMHMQGLSLWRVKNNDFCWDGKRICFIDPEQSAEAFNPKTNGRHNVVRFVFNTYYQAFKLQRDVHAETTAFLNGYASESHQAVEQTLTFAQKWCRRRWWIASLSLPVGFMRPLGRATDFKAVAPTLMLFTYFNKEKSVPFTDK